MAIPVFQKLEGALQSRVWIGAGGPEEIAAYTVPWADLVAAGFVAGDDVMIFARCFTGQSAAGAFFVPMNRLHHGVNFGASTEFPNTLSGNTHNWTTPTKLSNWVQMHRHTLVINENLYTSRQNWVFNFTQYNDQFALLVLGLDDLVEGTDFLFDEQAHAGAAPPAYDTSGAKVTVPAGGDDWFIFGHLAWSQNSTTTDAYSALDAGGATVAEIRRIARSTNEFRQEAPVHYMPAVGVGTDVQVLYRAPSADHVCNNTRLFALRLGAFRDHQGVKSTAVLTHSILNTPLTFGSFPAYEHGGAGANPLIVFAATKYSAPTENAKTPFVELLVDGASWPVADLFENCGHRPSGGNDKQGIVGFGTADVAPGNLAILGRVSETVDVTPNYPHDEHVMVAFSAELRIAPTLQALAVSKTQIDLTMGAAIGGTAHYLYRSTVEGFTPGPATLIATYGAVPPATLEDTGLVPGATYYYALVGLVGAVLHTTRASATTDGLTAPSLSVGGIGTTTAQLSTEPLPIYLEVEYFTALAASPEVAVDTQSVTGTWRYLYDLTALTPDTEYVSKARVRYAEGWSNWSDLIAWSTWAPGFDDPDHMGCPPIWSGIVHNPDGNAWHRLGVGFFRPQQGEPLRGAAAQIVFRWPSSIYTWDIYLSDDVGVGWAQIAAGLESVGTDADRLVLYRMTLNTLGLADGVDYQLRAVAVEDATEVWESMAFAVDNAEEVRWWKPGSVRDTDERWGKMWAEEGQTWQGVPTGDRIWYRGRDGGIGAIKGHDFAALVDRELPASFGADATVRFYIWSGEGGLFRLQGRDDTEGFNAGLVFFAQGLTTPTRQGLIVSVDNANSVYTGCCDDYLTSSQAHLAIRAVPVTGGNAEVLDIAATPRKMYFRAMKKPWQIGKEESVIIRPTFYVPEPTGGAYKPWGPMMWREGPEPGDNRILRGTCARRWEMYSLRVRAEVDPGDHSRVRVRARLDGPGVDDPAAGYWHYDEWLEFDDVWERGTTGLLSQQTAVGLYGEPNGARVFYSLSVLPLEPGDVPEIPNGRLPPWYEPLEGQPCSLNLLVYDEDRETVLWEVGTDALHPEPLLCVPENYGEQEVDVVNGAATLGRVEVIVIDRRQVPGDQDSGIMTERLGEGGIGRIHGRRCRLLRFIDFQRGWVVIADGPASAPRMDDTYAAFRWVIRDTRETERKVRAFVKADTSWLLPMGVEGGFGAYTDGDGDEQWLISPAAPLVGDYEFDAGDPFDTGSVNFADYWSGPPPGTETVEEAVVVSGPAEEALLAESEELGDPRPVLWTWPNLEIIWRLEGSADPWTVVQPTDLLPVGRSLAKPAGAGQWWRRLGSVFDAELAGGTEVRAVYALMIRGIGAAGTFPTDGDRIEVAVRYTGEPTENLPRHIQGMTSGEFLKKLYDGEYSPRDAVTGEVVPTAIRYNETDLLRMGGGVAFISLGTGLGGIALAGGGRLLLTTSPTAVDRVLLRQTEVVHDLRAWAEEHVYSPTGWFPALNNDGEISPRNQVPPDTFEGLLQIHNAVTEPKPDWDAGERIVNVITYTYPRWYGIPLDEPEERAATHRHAKLRDSPPGNSVDNLSRRDITIEYRDEASVTRHAIQAVTYDGDVFSAVGDVAGKPVVSLASEQGKQLTELRRLYVFDRYRNAAPTIQVPVMREHCALLRAGDWVVVDLSWFPDTVTRRRGLLTGCQLLAIYDVDCAWRILLLEEAFPIEEVS